jgi:hypothetical protein
VDKAQSIDIEKALLITERPHEHVANLNCQEMAAAANDKVNK